MRVGQCQPGCVPVLVCTCVRVAGRPPQLAAVVLVVGWLAVRHMPVSNARRQARADTATVERPRLLELGCLSDVKGNSTLAEL